MVTMALLLASALTASADTHTLTLTYRKGAAVYTTSVQAADGAQGSKVAKSAGRTMVFNAVPGVSSARPGRFQVQFQAELSQNRQSTVQLQDAVEARPGQSIDVLKCAGGWTISLALDAGPQPSAEGWDAAGLDNVRLDFSRGARRCSLVSQSGQQSNFVDSPQLGRSTVFNDVIVRGASGYSMQYQFQEGTNQAQSTIALAPGARVAADGGLTFKLLAAKPEAAAAAIPNAQAAPPAQTNEADHAVPLLR